MPEAERLVRSVAVGQFAIGADQLLVHAPLRGVGGAFGEGLVFSHAAAVIFVAARNHAALLRSRGLGRAAAREIDRDQNCGDAAFLQYKGDYLASFKARLDDRIGISHDLGFLYTLSAVALYKLTGDEEAKALALRAADMLCERYNEKGRYIQAWGEFNVGTPYVKIIVDTMLNLPLLFWAGETTGEARYTDIATAHAHTCADYLVREDYSSFHTYLMDPATGKAVEGRTHQGFHDNTTWARGQAWVVTGFALAYTYTKEPRFLEVSRRAAEVFLQNLPADFVPYWDFTFNDHIPDIRDSSAASIFTCGLLELAQYVDNAEAARDRAAARTIVRSLYDHYFLHDPDRAGVLTDAIYHRDTGATCVIWGDYFFYETLLRLLGGDKCFW